MTEVSQQGVLCSVPLDTGTRAPIVVYYGTVVSALIVANTLPLLEGLLVTFLSSHCLGVG